MKKLKTSSLFNLSLTSDELKDVTIHELIKKIIEVKLGKQRYSEFFIISEAEFELVGKYGEFVPSEKYEGKKLKGEVGKIRGKKLVIRERQ